MFPDELLELLRHDARCFESIKYIGTYLQYMYALDIYITVYVGGGIRQNFFSSLLFTDKIYPPSKGMKKNIAISYFPIQYVNFVKAPQILSSFHYM